MTFNLLLFYLMWNWTRKPIKLSNKPHAEPGNWLTGVQSAHRLQLIWAVVPLPSTRTKPGGKNQARGEIKYSVLRALIFMYIQHREQFLKMNNHRRKRSPLCWSSALWEWNNCFSHISSYCNEIVAVPWHWMTDYATVQSHKCGCVGLVGGEDGGLGVGGNGGQLAFVGKQGSPKSLHESFVSLSVLFN